MICFIVVGEIKEFVGKFINIKLKNDRNKERERERVESC